MLKIKCLGVSYSSGKPCLRYLLKTVIKNFIKTNALCIAVVLCSNAGMLGLPPATEIFRNVSFAAG